jgi:bifunctional non-homologous end joining protein LigD
MTRNTSSKIEPGRFAIPRDREAIVAQPDGKDVALTNLRKVFFPQTGTTKGDLLQYYADVAPFLVPYMQDRAQVMKRYPNGASGDFFYMKRTPSNAPPWLRTCSIEHGSGSVIAFPIVDDMASLLWLVNLGCIDLNEWYSRCDDTDRPDYLHFDLDPVKDGSTSFAVVRKVALYVHEALDELGIPAYAKTSGSSGIHVYVPIERGPRQKEVWTFAKAFAQTMERLHPDVITAEYRIAKRPSGRVLVDYNQNAWGKTLASVYSVRAKPDATVSTPVTWDEIEAGCEIGDFRLDNVRERFVRLGDLWAPMKKPTGRLKLERFLAAPGPGPRAPRRRGAADAGPAPAGTG